MGKVYEADVAVIGAGPSGCSAAIAAARMGARVLLIESNGFLGGVATTGLVLTWPINTGGADQDFGGIPGELVDALKSRKSIRPVIIADPSDDPHRWWIYDQEVLKYILDDIVRQSGVKVLFHSNAIGAERTTVESEASRWRVSSVTVANKSGLQEIKAKVYVDATGDADLANMVGCPYVKGRPEDGKMMPMTSCFRLGGVDFQRLDIEEARRLYREARGKGELTVPHHYINVNPLYPGMVQIFVTRVLEVDGTQVEDLTRAEFESRDQIKEVYSFLKAQVQGFEESYVVDSSVVVGVRDTRRIIGEYVLTGQDVREGRKFDDGIATGTYRIDLHNPSGEGTTFHPLGKGVWYHIPYRCLIPRNAQNLLVAGRAISGTWEAFGSYRVMPICMLTGQAAGTAAALSVRQNRNGDVRSVEIPVLQHELKRQGVFI